MAKYLLLKHYRGAPAAVNDVPMDQWEPEEVTAHIQYMRDFAARLEGTGEYVDGQALSPEGTFVRSDGEGRPPITDGPFAETKDLIAELDGDRRRDLRAGDRAGRMSCPRLRVRVGSRSTSGSSCARSTPSCPRPPSERLAAPGAGALGDRCPRPPRSRLRGG